MKALKHFMNGEAGQKYSYSIFSMRRGGQHLVADWILEKQVGSYLFLNDVVINRDPYGTTFGNFTHKSNRVLLDRFPKFMGKRMYKDVLVFNFEDPVIEQVYDIKKFIGRSEKHYNILVVRDIYNLFASRLKGLGRFCEDVRISLFLKELWKVHAREYLRYTQHLPQVIPINYNKLLTDSLYRKAMSNKLQIASELPIKQTREGGGSSFQVETEKLEAKSINSRFMQYLDHPFYISMFEKDKELYDLNVEIFGDSLHGYLDDIKKFSKL